MSFTTASYAKKYFVSDEIEFVTEKDLEFDITYKIPEDLLSLIVNDLKVNNNLIVDNRVGIGTTQPQQRLDIAGSIKIDENIYDSVNTPARNGYFLSRDDGGIRWIPLIAESRTDNGIGTIIGIRTDGIFVLDEGTPLYPE
jgi:hypothetical protein